MQLLEVLKNIDYELISGDLNKEITSVEYDSRKVSVGSLFVCVKGFTVDGHSYAKSAAEKDASAIVVDSTRDGFPKEELDQLAKDYDLCIVEINDTHKHLADLCANFFEHPEKKLAVYGITGTKGKTTTASMVRSVLEKGGIKTGIIGTLGILYGDNRLYKHYNHFFRKCPVNVQYYSGFTHG